MDPKEPSRVNKIVKCLGTELTKQLTMFLNKNQDMFDAYRYGGNLSECNVPQVEY